MQCPKESIHILYYLKSLSKQHTNQYTLATWSMLAQLATDKSKYNCQEVKLASLVKREEEN